MMILKFVNWCDVHGFIGMLAFLFVLTFSCATGLIFVVIIIDAAEQQIVHNLNSFHKSDMICRNCDIRLK